MDNIIEKLKKVKSSWEFVEHFYDGYSGCDEIADNNDLQKIVDGEVNGCAIIDYKRIAESLGIDLKLTEEEEENFHDHDFDYENRISKEDHQRIVAVAQAELDGSNSYVFERAIEGLIEDIQAKLKQDKEQKSTYYLFGTDQVYAYDSGFATLLIHLNKEGDMPSIFEFIEGRTPSTEFAEAISGWGDYTTITAEEYQVLNELKITLKN